MVQDDLSQEISKYYDGELSDEKTRDITLKLKKDPEAKKALDLLKDIGGVLDDREFPGERNFKTALKEKISGLHASIKAEQEAQADDLPMPVVNEAKRDGAFPLWLILLGLASGLGVLGALLWHFS